MANVSITVVKEKRQYLVSSYVWNDENDNNTGSRYVTVWYNTLLHAEQQPLR